MSRRFPPLPFSAQVLGLTLVSIVVAQAVTLFAVQLAPVLPPPHYRVGEVAAALRGDALTPHGRRPLHRFSATALPDTFKGHDDSAAHAALAQAMGLPNDDLRLVVRGPPTLMIATSQMGRDALGGHPGGPRPGGGDDPPSLPNGGPPHGGPPRDGPPDGPPNGMPPDRTFGQPPIMQAEMTFTEFSAARKLPDGTWSIVEPAPEHEWARRLYVWLIGGMVIMGPVAWLFSRRITGPVRRFAHAADQLGRDPAAPQMALNGPAEIGLAANAFNQMRARLQRYVADRVSMMGAISHDLRTPLTRIRFKLERADPELRASVLSDVAQMEDMIASVLAYMKDADAQAPREQLDLTSLLNCAVDDQVAAGKAVALNEDAPMFLVDGDPVALRRMVDNLIDNAVKYGTTARLDVRLAGNDGELLIEDDGPGLPADQFDAVFQPFYRFRPGGPVQGTGLGLTSARTIARSHGGDIRLAPGARGLRVTVSLPRPAASAI